MRVRANDCAYVTAGTVPEVPGAGAAVGAVRRRARVDANHAEVRSALRAAGWTVVDCAGVGSGFPDLLIAKHGRVLMVEIKDGAKVPSKQKLTEDEVQFHALMAAAGVVVSVVTSVEEALAL